MSLYFDTSALIKRYIQEDGSGRVDTLFESAENILVSPITEIEMYSVLIRLKNEKALSRKMYKELIEEIEKDFKFFIKIPWYPKVENTAVNLIKKHDLRTLDSIQLAGIVTNRSIIKNFIVSDIKLKQAAKKEKLKVIDPTDSNLR